MIEPNPQPSAEQRIRAMGRQLRRHAYILGGIVLLLWLLEFVDWLILGERLDYFGIQPRQIEGLRGVLFAPFLHNGFGHLAANTLPLIILGWLVLLRGQITFILVSLIAIFVSGIGTWLIGPTFSIHLGASGLVFGYLGYLLLRGYFERSASSLAMAALVGVLYGSLIWGVLPQSTGISWQGHLFGFVGGGLAAYILSPLPPNRL